MPVVEPRLVLFIGEAVREIPAAVRDSAGLSAVVPAAHGAARARKRKPSGAVTSSSSRGLRNGPAQIADLASPVRTFEAPAIAATPALGAEPMRPVAPRRRQRRRVRRLSQSHIRRAVARNRASVERCYARQSRGVGAGRDLRVVLHLSVNRDGAVTRASVTPARSRNSAFGRCIARAARRWQFPSARDASSFEMPFVVASGRR
jgi:TonB family protein